MRYLLKTPGENIKSQCRVAAGHRVENYFHTLLLLSFSKSLLSQKPLSYYVHILLSTGSNKLYCCIIALTAFYTRHFRHTHFKSL